MHAFTGETVRLVHICSALCHLFSAMIIMFHCIRQMLRGTAVHHVETIVRAGGCYWS